VLRPIQQVLRRRIAVLDSIVQSNGCDSCHSAAGCPGGSLYQEYVFIVGAVAIATLVLIF
jgi:hypothetical protein